MRLPFATWALMALVVTTMSPAAAAPPAPAPTPVPLAVPVGASLATVTGSRLFPRLVGEPMPGWLQAYGGAEMGSAYEGYHEEKTLPGGVRQVTLRTQGLMGVYLLQGDRCIGQLLFEPQLVEGADGLPPALRRAGFSARVGVLASADRGYGAHVTIHERRRAGLVEQYLLLDLPYREDTVVHLRPVVGAEVCFPARLEGAMAAVITQGKAALAEFCRIEEQKARNPAR